MQLADQQHAVREKVLVIAGVSRLLLMVKTSRSLGKPHRHHHGASQKLGRLTADRVPPGQREELLSH
jgi:hypothetical protein